MLLQWLAMGGYMVVKGGFYASIWLMRCMLVCMVYARSLGSFVWLSINLYCIFPGACRMLWMYPV